MLDFEGLLEEINDLKQYKLYKLGEICEFKRGKRITKQDLTETGYPVISAGSKIFGYYSNWNTDPNTVTMAQFGQSGYVGFTNERFWCTDNSLRLIPNEELVLDKFLYYSLKSKQDLIYSFKTQSTLSMLQMDKVKNLDIWVPPIPIQNKIVHFLDVFTALITALRTEEKKRKEKKRKEKNNKLAIVIV